MVSFIQLAMICDANTFLIVASAQVMDYADGGDLHQRIQRTRQAGKVFSEDRIVRRRKQLTAAVFEQTGGHDLGCSNMVNLETVQANSVFFRVVVFVGEVKLPFQQNLRFPAESW